MALDERGEGQLGGLAVVGGEALEELAVGELADGAEVEERPELARDGPMLADGHRRDPPPDRPLPR